MAEIGDCEQRDTGRSQLFDQSVHTRDRTRNTVEEARLPRRDQLRMLRVQRDQLRRGFGEVASRIMLEMPFMRQNIAQERVERLAPGDETLVQEPWVPVVKNAADIKDNGSGRDAQP